MRSNTPASVRLIVVIAALGVFGTLGAQAIPRGLADIAAYEGRRALKRAWADPAPARSAAWQQARDRLDRAHTLEPSHPHTIELLAYWHAESARHASRDRNASRAQLQTSAGLWRSALARRPASPYAWTSLAVIKQQLGELDDEFRHALARAAKLGPWEPELQLRMAEIAFTADGALDARTRAALQGVILNALHHQDRAVFDLARRHRAMHILCATPDVGRSLLAVNCI